MGEYHITVSEAWTVLFAGEERSLTVIITCLTRFSCPARQNIAYTIVNCATVIKYVCSESMLNDNFSNSQSHTIYLGLYCLVQGIFLAPSTMCIAGHGFPKVL